MLGFTTVEVAVCAVHGAVESWPRTTTWGPWGLHLKYIECEFSGSGDLLWPVPKIYRSVSKAYASLSVDKSRHVIGYI